MPKSKPSQSGRFSESADTGSDTKAPKPEPKPPKVLEKQDQPRKPAESDSASGG